MSNDNIVVQAPMEEQAIIATLSRCIETLDEKRKVMKGLREDLKHNLDGDEAYSKHKLEKQEADKTAKAKKDELLQKEENKFLDQKIQDLSAEMKELQEQISAYGFEYIQRTKKRFIDLPNGKRATLATKVSVHQLELFDEDEEEKE